MAIEVVHQLSEREARKLVAEINAGAEDLGNKLIRLCREMGWASLGYTSFRECCKAEFANNSWALGKSPTWVCRQIQSVETKAELPIGNEDLPESVVRELNKLPKDQRADAWQDITERLGDNPTAAQVAHEVDLMLPPDDDPAESPTIAQDATDDEEASEDDEAEEDAGDGGPSLFNELLEYCSQFHEERCPETSLPAFAAVLESVADKIRGLV